MLTLTRMVIDERGGLIAVYFITLSDRDRDGRLANGSSLILFCCVYNQLIFFSIK